jgi:hypothetical protein
MKYLIIFVSLLLILILSFNLRIILTNKELFYQTPPTVTPPVTPPGPQIFAIAMGSKCGLRADDTKRDKYHWRNALWDCNGKADNIVVENDKIYTEAKGEKCWLEWKDEINDNKERNAKWDCSKGEGDKGDTIFVENDKIYTEAKGEKCGLQWDWGSSRNKINAKWDCKEGKEGDPITIENRNTNISTLFPPSTKPAQPAQPAPSEQLGCNDEQHNNIISDKNIFFDKKDVTINNINCDKLCIVEDNDNVECITKAELFNAINLPAFRKHSICIGDACITNNVINKVNGKERINLKSNYKLNPKFKNKCLNQTTDTATTCSRQKFRWETGTYTGWTGSELVSCPYQMPNMWNTKGSNSGSSCRGGRPARVEWRRERRWIKDMNSYSSQYNLVDKSNYNMELLKSDNCDKTNKNNKFSIHMGLPVSSIETELKKSEFNYVPKKVAHNQHINRQNT